MTVSNHNMQWFPGRFRYYRMPTRKQSTIDSGVILTVDSETSLLHLRHLVVSHNRKEEGVRCSKKKYHPKSFSIGSSEEEEEWEDLVHSVGFLINGIVTTKRNQVTSAASNSSSTWEAVLDFEYINLAEDDHEEGPGKLIMAKNSRHHLSCR